MRKSRIFYEDRAQRAQFQVIEGNWQKLTLNYKSPFSPFSPFRPQSPFRPFSPFSPFHK